MKSSAPDVDDLLYQLTHAAVIVTILHQAQSRGFKPQWPSPLDQQWLEKAGVSVGDVSVDAVRRAHERYLELLDGSVGQLQPVPAEELLSLLPRLLSTDPESWDRSRGLG